MVDVEGGNNMMYLPLDKIMEQQVTYPRPLPKSTSTITDSGTSRPSSPSTSGRSDRFNSGRN